MNIKNAYKYIKKPDKQLSECVSLLVTFVFAVYNLYLGIKHNDAWGYSIAVYYFCMVTAKTVIVITEYIISRKQSKNEEKVSQVLNCV